MKISNRSQIIRINRLTVCFSIIIISLWSVYHFLEFKDNGFAVSSLLWFLLFLNILVILFSISRQKVFEFESSGEVVTIKTYSWFSSRKPVVSPAFEMPCKKITKVSIRRLLFKQYVELYFRSDSGKRIKTTIDIRGATRIQIKHLYDALQNCQ